MAVFPGRGSIWWTSCGAPSEEPGSEPEPRHQVFGRRRGRALRAGQKVLISELLPRLAINLPATGHLDTNALFGNARPAIWLEIGFGGGEHLAQLAEQHPQAGFIGCEVFENGIVKLLARIERRRLENIRIFADDARFVMAALPPASIGRVFILFPDPWPKRGSTSAGSCRARPSTAWLKSWLTVPNCAWRPMTVTISAGFSNALPLTPPSNG